MKVRCQIIAPTGDSLRDGWRAVQDQPVVRAFLQIVALVNAISYMGSLFPALVRVQMHGSVRAYGFLEASSVLGGIAGGIERHIRGALR